MNAEVTHLTISDFFMHREGDVYKLYDKAKGIETRLQSGDVIYIHYTRRPTQRHISVYTRYMSRWSKYRVRPAYRQVSIHRIRDEKEEPIEAIAIPVEHYNLTKPLERQKEAMKLLTQLAGGRRLMRTDSCAFVWSHAYRVL
jgi:hypothetical protein